MTTTITATVEPSATPPRVRLNVTSDQSEVVLYRVAADATETPVRSYDGGPIPISGGVALVYDPEVPYGAPVAYTSDDAATTDSDEVTVDVAAPWLTHPGVPVLSQPITPKSIGPREHEAQQSVRYPLGSRFPIVANDGRRKAPVYDLVLQTETIDELEGLQALLDDMAPLLLNIPASLGWGVTHEYVRVGALRELRPSDYGGDQIRHWALPCTVVRRPAGGSRADITYGYSYALYPTYGDRYAAHATYGEAAGL